MYPTRYIQYLNLPKIPQYVIDSLIRDVEQHRAHHNSNKYGNVYVWSDLSTDLLNTWCRENISDEMYYGLQLMPNDVPIHQDVGTKIKINYLIDTGGNNVLTNFYDNDGTTELASYCIDVGRWHIFKADTHHEVKNIENTRISVTSRIF
jgi:hypothetical protein